MKPVESKALYEKACGVRRIKPQQEEYEQWHKNIRDFEPRDVQAALDAWWASTERDRDGDAKSKWLPTPGELLGLVIAARDKRIVRAREPEDLVFLMCSAGHRSSCFVVRSAEFCKRTCRCGAEIKVLQREAA